MKYMLLFYADEAAWMVLSEEERNAAIEQIGRWYGAQVESGRLVEGRRLAGESSVKTVDLGPAGRSRPAAPAVQRDDVASCGSTSVPSSRIARSAMSGSIPDHCNRTIT